MASAEAQSLACGAGLRLFPGRVPADVVRAARDHILAQAEHAAFEVPGLSKRVLDVLDARPELFARAILDAMPLDELGATFGAAGPFMTLGSYHGHVLYPADAAEPELVAAFEDGAVHTDYPYWLHERAANEPFSVQLIVMLDDFTHANGATLIAPGSHLWPAGPVRDTDAPLLYRSSFHPLTAASRSRWRASAQPVCGAAGDCFAYIGQCWHAAGVNRTAVPRVALLLQFLPYYVAPMETLAWTMRTRTRRLLSPRAARLFGTGKPFGFVYPARLAPRPLASTVGLLADAVLAAPPWWVVGLGLAVMIWLALFGWASVLTGAIGAVLGVALLVRHLNI